MEQRKIKYETETFLEWLALCEKKREELKRFDDWINWFMSSEIYHWCFKHHWLMVHDSTVKDLMADLHQATKGSSWMTKQIKAFEKEANLQEEADERVRLKEFIKDLKHYHTFKEKGYLNVNYIDDLIEKYEKRLKS